MEIERQDCLLGLLERGRNRRDTDKTVIEELGFYIGLWNGAATAEKEVGLGVQCGSYILNPNLGNCVTLDLPEDLGGLRDPDCMAAVVSTVVRAWDPDWAGVMSSEAISVRDFDARVPFVDWILYLSNRLAQKGPSFTPPTTVHNVDRLGTIVVVQPEPTDPANPEHMRRIEHVEAWLNATP